MLMQKIENLIFRKAAPMAIDHLAQPDLATKEPLTRKVLDQALREFQLAPPITLHISDPKLLAGIWSATRETYVVNVKGRAMRGGGSGCIETQRVSLLCHRACFDVCCGWW